MAANTTAEQIQLREFENVTCIEGGEAHPITPYTVPAPPLHPPPPCCVVGWRLVDFWLVCRLLVGRSAWKVGLESVCFLVGNSVWKVGLESRLGWKLGPHARCSRFSCAFSRKELLVTATACFSLLIARTGTGHAWCRSVRFTHSRVMMPLGRQQYAVQSNK